MADNIFDMEIRKFLPLLENKDKKSLLTIIKEFLRLEEQPSSNKGKQKPESIEIDYSKYHFPVSAIKFNRDEINER